MFLKSFKIFLASTLILMLSCDNEKEDLQIGKVGFSSQDIIEIESATLPLGINIGVDTYNHSGGTVHVEVQGGTYGVDYTLNTGSDSFDLNIAKGAQIATFVLTPINDNTVDSNVDLVFKITSVSGGLEKSQDDEIVVKLLEDDVPTIGTISFASTSLQVNEDNTSENVIAINFNQPTTYGGTINITSSGDAVYGQDFSITGQTSGNFTITVPPLATSAEIRVSSIDELVADNNKNLTLTISSVTGGLQVQSPNATTITFIDNDIVPILINYVETFEGNTGTNYLGTLGYTVLPVNQSSNITTLMSANTTAASYSDVNNVSGTSNSGINLNYTAGSPLNSALAGDLDQVLISPNFNANGVVTFSLDYNFGFITQNNALVTFYYSTTYSGGAFNLSEWTVLGTDTGANMVATGTPVNIFKRRTFQVSPTNNFRFAIRVTQNINATNYRTRWRFDNFKLNN